MLPSWLRIAVALPAVVAVALVPGACGGPTRGVAGAPSTSSTVSPSGIPTTTSGSSPDHAVAPSTPTPASTSSVPPSTAPPRSPRTPATLQPGASGPGVVSLQRRLAGLGYWLGPADGRFGDSTEQAVFALQKSAGIDADGIVGSRTLAALAAGVVPRPRSSAGTGIEVDLERDLLLIVAGGRLEAVLNTSTGGGYLYADQGVTARAETPRGRFAIYRQVDGLVVDSLGALWRPKFFEGGFAIHGDSYVPPEPVSHGCVRVSNEAIDWIWAAGMAPIGTTVWVY